MPRTILEEARLHPAIRERVGTLNADIVHNVQAAAGSNAVLVVGMAGNPIVRRARKALEAAGIAFHYLEYGSYFSEWRRRNALKMWTGWPTFPMIFVKGSLVGGGHEIEALIASGELKRILGE
ncbi:MAG: glutaredoxin domain-containing protein [Caldimonas sp.]